MSHVTLAPREVAVPPTLALLLSTASDSAPPQIGAAMTAAFQRLGGVMASQPLSLAGPPRAIYTGMGAGRVEFAVAIPLASAPPQPLTDPAVRVDTIAGQRALRFTHHGPYDQLAATYRQITAWLIDQKLIESEAGWSKFMPMWEEYESDPDCTPAAELVANIYLPLA